MKKASKKIRKISLNLAIILAMLMQSGMPGAYFAFASEPLPEPEQQQKQSKNISATNAGDFKEKSGEQEEEKKPAADIEKSDAEKKVDPVKIMEEEQGDEEQGEAEKESGKDAERLSADPVTDLAEDKPSDEDAAVKTTDGESLFPESFPETALEPAILLPQPIVQSDSTVGIMNGGDDEEAPNKIGFSDKIKTCAGEGRLYAYAGDPFQDIDTYFTIDSESNFDQLWIFMRSTVEETDLEILVNGEEKNPTLLLPPASPAGNIRIYGLDVNPGDKIVVKGDHPEGARRIQGYMAQNKNAPPFALSTRDSVYGGQKITDVTLTPGTFQYVYFDKYSINAPGRGQDNRKVEVKITNGGTISDKEYTSPNPSPAEGVVIDTYTIAESGVYNFDVISEDSVYWLHPICEIPVLEKAEITAIKFNDLNGNGEENAGEPALSGWEMELFSGSGCDQNNFIRRQTTNASGETLFADLEPGNYSVREILKTGWRNTTGICQNVSPDFGENRFVRFGNQEQGRVIVRKITVPSNSSRSFNFESSWGNFSLRHGESNDSGFLNAGTYAVRERSLPSNWDLSSAVCSDGSRASSISLSPGETVTCTFTNVREDDDDDDDDDDERKVVIRISRDDDRGEVLGAVTTLPVTGGNNLVLTLAGLVILAFGSGLVIRNRKKLHVPGNNSFWSSIFAGVLVGGSMALIGFSLYPMLHEEVRYHSNSTGEMDPVDNNFGIVIPKLSANAKIISEVDSQNADAYQAALVDGVAHAKGTAHPGEWGNMFVFAHSGTDFLRDNRFNMIFYHLDELEGGDQIYIYKNGTKHSYAVKEKKIVEASDSQYLKKEADGKILTLMTCWPAGSTDKRLVVIAQQI